MIGNLLQQCYNIADTLIVGRFLGADALAAVGSAYTWMVFLTSIILGLCMGSSAFFSMQFGAGNTERLKKSFFLAFVLVFHWGVKGAAVYYESGYPDGSGAGKQFRNCSYGSLRSSSEN